MPQAGDGAAGSPPIHTSALRAGAGATLMRGDRRMPLYHRLHDLLREAIESGVLRPGDRVPTEAELGARFGVSRTTVKQAIQQLVQAGLVYRVQGKGTFVSQPRIHRRLAGLISFHDEMRQRGYTPGTELLEKAVVPAPRHAAQALELAPGTPVLLLVRLRLADEVPIALQSSYLAGECGRRLAADPQAGHGSLYEAMERLCGQRPAFGREEYSAVVISGESARRLGVPEGSPALSVRRFARLADGQPVEYTESLLRADRYTLHVELAGQAQPPAAG